MNQVLQLSAGINILFLLLHELDAVYRQEWKMFPFLSGYKEIAQYRIFLFAHIPLFAFILYYFATVLFFDSKLLWIIVNACGVFHLIIHLFALKWKTNVFFSPTSFLLITGIGVTGAINLLLTPFYIIK